VIRALVVDDEPLARARLRRLISAEPDVEIAGECADGASALAALTRTAVDLLVLDIEMPVADGLTVATTARDVAIIFVTAHEHYARHAFDVDAIDYLMKPVDPVRLAEALRRMRRRIKPARIAARTGNRIRFVDADDIDWIEAQGNYVALHAGGRVELIRDTLSSIENRLDPDRFARVHRGAIVRIDRIRELVPQPTGEYRIRLRNGADLVSGRTYRARLATLARGTWPKPA
jgi:two-component system LytT family response regulator